MTTNSPAPAAASRRLWRRLALTGAGVLVAVGVAAAMTVTWLVNATPNVDDLTRVGAGSPSVIVFSGGEPLARVGEVVYEPLKLADAPPFLIDALIATEDVRFRQHNGIDVRRIAGAAWSTLHGNLQGGSTLTQQLARNLFPDDVGRQRSLWRKLREMTVAMKLEHKYSKDQILELYLNNAPFLYNVVGFEMAARTYFDRPAAKLDPVQAATLVGMLKGSHLYNPVRNPDRALERRNLVLRQVQRQHALNQAQVAAWIRQPLGLHFNRPEMAATAAPHFVATVRRQLDEWADRTGHNLQRDGLTIAATLDAKLQALAQKAVEQQTAWLQRNAGANVRASDRADLAPRASQLEAGFVAIDPRNGEVRAWVGARSDDDHFDHVAQAKRQPGSTFKPFVYGAALRAGLSPGRAYVDEPIEVPLGNGKFWRPTDMGAPTGMPMTLREGLAQSKNTITTQLARDIGVRAVADYARKAGVRTKLDEVPSLALGTSPVSLLEMTSAYATLANMGIRHEPLLIRKILDRQGRTVADFSSPAEPAIDSAQVERLVDMMRDVINVGTGGMLRSRFGVRDDIAGKTGTSQRNTDAWFIAMKPSLVTGAWVGFNDPRVTMRSNYWGQGGHSALLLVGDFLKRAGQERVIERDDRFPVVEREMPEGVARSWSPWDAVPDSPAEDGHELMAPWQDASNEGADRRATRSPTSLANGNVVVGRDANGRLVIGDRRGVRVMTGEPDLDASVSEEGVSGSASPPR